MAVGPTHRQVWSAGCAIGTSLGGKPFAVVSGLGVGPQEAQRPTLRVGLTSGCPPDSGGRESLRRVKAPRYDELPIWSLVRPSAYTRWEVLQGIPRTVQVSFRLALSAAPPPNLQHTGQGHRRGATRLRVMLCLSCLKRAEGTRMDSKSMQAGVTPALPASLSLQEAALLAVRQSLPHEASLFSTPGDTGGSQKPSGTMASATSPARCSSCLAMAWA